MSLAVNPSDHHRHRSLARPVLLVAGSVVVLGLLARPAAAGLLVQLDSAGPGTTAGLWVARLVNHLALAVTVGCLLVPAWLLHKRSRADDAPSAAADVLGRRASRAAAVAAGVWALAGLAIFVFGASNAAARPLPEALDGALLARFAGTRLGTALLLQLGLALVVALLAAMARGRSGARLTLVVTLLGALGPAWWGHAGTAEPIVLAVTSDWLHISGAAVWVGGLLALAALILPKGSGLDPFGPTVRFSGLAGWSLLVVSATGMINTFLHTAEASQLVETTWGRLSLAKALLLLGLAGFGWAHRRRFIPRLRGGNSTVARSAFVRVAGVELVVMLIAMGLATSMASGLPAGVEAATYIQTFTAPVEGGFVEVSLDPARAGVNELHLYILDTNNVLRVVADARVWLRSAEAEEVEARLVRSGPGHFTGPAVEVPSSGTWEVHVRIEAHGAVEEVRGSVTLR